MLMFLLLLNLKKRIDAERRLYFEGDIWFRQFTGESVPPSQKMGTVPDPRKGSVKVTTKIPPPRDQYNRAVNLVYFFHIISKKGEKLSFTFTQVYQILSIYLKTRFYTKTSFLAIFGPKYRFETKIVSMKP